MFKIDVNEKKNRLYITIAGNIPINESQEIALAVAQALTRLSKGFTCITDISTYTSFNPADSVWVEEVQKMLHDWGMSAVVRVVGESEIPQLVLNWSSKSVRGYSAASAKSLAEAEQILDEIQMK